MIQVLFQEYNTTLFYNVTTKYYLYPMIVSLPSDYHGIVKIIGIIWYKFVPYIKMVLVSIHGFKQ